MEAASLRCSVAVLIPSTSPTPPPPVILAVAANDDSIKATRSIVVVVVVVVSLPFEVVSFDDDSVGIVAVGIVTATTATC